MYTPLLLDDDLTEEELRDAQEAARAAYATLREGNDAR